jgi:Domain of unknown function (DUF4145)
LSGSGQKNSSNPFRFLVGYSLLVRHYLHNGSERIQQGSRFYEVGASAGLASGFVLANPHSEVAAPYGCDRIIARMGCRSESFSRDSEARSVAFDIAFADVLSAERRTLVSAKRGRFDEVVDLELLSTSEGAEVSTYMPAPSDWSIQFQRNNNIITAAAEARAICPHCKNASTFTIKTQYYAHAVNLTMFHLVLECNYATCRKIAYVLTSEPTVHPHLPHNLAPQQQANIFLMHPSRAIEPPHPSLPAQIADDWIEAQKAMEAGAPKAAAVMFRRVLYSVLMDKGCKLHPLRDGLTDLIQGQRLPAIFDDWLPAIRDDGHDGAHPDRALHVSHENVAETKEYTAELLRFLYIEPHEFLLRKGRNTTAAPPANP